MRNRSIVPWVTCFRSSPRVAMSSGVSPPGMSRFGKPRPSSRACWSCAGVGPALAGVAEASTDAAGALVAEDSTGDEDWPGDEDWAGAEGGGDVWAAGAVAVAGAEAAAGAAS